MPDAVDFLVIFMSLTCDDNKVICFRPIDSVFNGLLSILDDDCFVGIATRKDFFGDACRVFTARVVVGNDDIIRPLLGY